jgi:hypothetical protein
MTLVNLTPHPVTLVSETRTLTLHPTGHVARVAVTQTAIPPVVLADGFQVAASAPTFGDVVGLPAPASGVVFVVSALVRNAVPDRLDVASPGDLVRDDAGNVLGCRELQFNPRP